MAGMILDSSAQRESAAPSRCNGVGRMWGWGEGRTLWYMAAKSANGLCRDVKYRGADKSLARPTSRCILFDGENISFDASLVIYVNSTNNPPIVIINRIYETQNLL